MRSIKLATLSLSSTICFGDVLFGCELGGKVCKIVASCFRSQKVQCIYCKPSLSAQSLAAPVWNISPKDENNHQNISPPPLDCPLKSVPYTYKVNTLIHYQSRSVLIPWVHPCLGPSPSLSPLACPPVLSCLWSTHKATTFIPEKNAFIFHLASPLSLSPSLSWS